MSFNPVISASIPITMTSSEIAAVTGKQHKNILRDVDEVLTVLGSNLSQGFKQTTYSGNDGK